MMPPTWGGKSHSQLSELVSGPQDTQLTACEHPCRVHTAGARSELYAISWGHGLQEGDRGLSPGVGGSRGGNPGQDGRSEPTQGRDSSQVPPSSSDILGVRGPSGPPSLQSLGTLYKVPPPKPGPVTGTKTVSNKKVGPRSDGGLPPADFECI